jgi:hypothetical protein
MWGAEYVCCLRGSVFDLKMEAVCLSETSVNLNYRELTFKQAIPPLAHSVLKFPDISSECFVFLNEDLSTNKLLGL